MFLTIALPIYNKEKYLKKCIDSILAQECINFELLLVDDGSKDNSLKICKEYASKHPDIIRVICKNNSGSLLTRRVCIAEAKGEYILILDGDDYLLDVEATKKIENFITRVSCDLLIFNYTENAINRKKAFNPGYEGDQVLVSKSDLYHKVTKDSSFLNPLFNKVFKKEIVDQDDYELVGWVSNGTDYYQMLPLLTNATKVSYLDEVLYYYRIVPNSIAHSFNPKIYASLKEGYRRLENLSKTWEIDDRELFDRELLGKKISICTTSAYKVRMCSVANKSEAFKYLYEISNDSFFRDTYKMIKKRSFKIAGRRKIVSEFLFRKMNIPLYYLLRIMYIVSAD